LVTILLTQKQVSILKVLDQAPQGNLFEALRGLDPLEPAAPSFPQSAPFWGSQCGRSPREAVTLTASNWPYTMETELWNRHSLHQSSSMSKSSNQLAMNIALMQSGRGAPLTRQIAYCQLELVVGGAQP
jgi:hypothetical protein